MLSPENKVESDGEPQREGQQKPKPVKKRHVCGANVTHCNFNRHAKTKKHRDAEYFNFVKFKMKSKKLHSFFFVIFIK